ncbi:MAG TPA: alanine--tRNA ligase [Pseudomonadota bacterium]|nr:alanine--tRNA ligase [Rhodanobacteraceae bacterium]MBP9155180.1 alanine--tRNA ligase [Xanthomonadales bacterium]HQW80481.1 alanine--tRNA ligase [Pseudomonadota bacterium]
MKSSAEIRTAFIEFFKSKGHEHVASSPLVPGNDPTLLFTNSGMVQFKDMFLGAEKRSYTRAVTAQRCVRAGGKHNDLENVGYTARHHTFFEMLGNFSFGDYFKRDAIHYAWQLLTNTYGLPADKLWVTVYHTDDEAFAIWNGEVGVPVERIVRIGDNKGAPYASDNFWQMADTGPCGPCSEIFYDHGPAVAGGPPGSDEQDGDRYIEIWNLVFMQFERASDGTLTPLPKPCVDTGMGLERLTAVLQHVNSNYDIDLMKRLVEAAATATATTDLGNPSLRVIADHIRATSFMIVDGVLPSNEGRGYVLRRIIRRALRHGHKLGCKVLFFSSLVKTLVAEMGGAYPELVHKQAQVERILKNEEERFAETLDQGMKVFEELTANGANQISGDDAFKLYDTYGFPLDLTADVARERGLLVDLAGFEKAMEAQRERARAASKFDQGFVISAEQSAGLAATQFVGYTDLDSKHVTVERLLVANQTRTSIASGERAVVILDRTPFYAESGGQVGDTGVLRLGNAEFVVTDTIKLAGVYHGHVGALTSGSLKLADRVVAEVDVERRAAIVLNHSATHLLHAALRQVLGEHVQQKGSLVAPDRLRFDFSHFQPMTDAELKQIETIVNTEVRRNAEAEVHQMSMQEALDFGAMALFGEKYGEHVRVLKMGEFSTELCGGTHVGRTGDIGLMKITSEGGIASGVRRIEAVTGTGAMALVDQREARLDDVAELVGASEEDVVAKLKQLLDRQKKLEKELDALKAKNANALLNELAESAPSIGGIHIVTGRIEGIDAKTLRDAVEALRNKLGDCAVVLAAVAEGKASLVAGVAGAGLAKLKAGELISHVASQINGKGGGRPDMAQGGGDDTPALIPALVSVLEFAKAKIG